MHSCLLSVSRIHGLFKTRKQWDWSVQEPGEFISTPCFGPQKSNSTTLLHRRDSNLLNGPRLSTVSSDHVSVGHTGTNTHGVNEALISLLQDDSGVGIDLLIGRSRTGNTVVVIALQRGTPAQHGSRGTVEAREKGASHSVLHGLCPEPGRLVGEGVVELDTVVRVGIRRGQRTNVLVTRAVDFRGNAPGRVGVRLATTFAASLGVGADDALDQVARAVGDAQPREEVGALVRGHGAGVDGGGGLDDCVGGRAEGKGSAPRVTLDESIGVGGGCGHGGGEQGGDLCVLHDEEKDCVQICLRANECMFKKVVYMYRPCLSGSKRM